MKKQVPSTFILNANDASYFYVEGKYSSIHGPIYCVYYNSDTKPVRYNAKNFVEVHGINEKESILNFTSNALPDLVALTGYDSRAQFLYDTFSEVHEFVSNQDYKRPRLGKLKNVFIDAVSTFNELRCLLPTVDISYEEDYRSLYGEKAEIKKVKKIVTIPSARKEVNELDNLYEDSKSVQRKLKYD